MKLKQELQAERKSFPRAADAAVGLERLQREFDPHTHISAADREWLEQYIDAYLDLNSINETTCTRLVHYLFQLNTISPESTHKILSDSRVVDVLKEYGRDVQRYLETYPRDASYLPRKLLLISLFPNYREDLDASVDIDEFAPYKHSLKAELAIMNYIATLKLVEHIMMFFPERKAELGLDEQFYEKLVRNTQYFNPKQVSSMYYELYSVIALAYPERRQELQVPQELIDQLKQNLQQTRNSDMEAFVKYARFLSLLTADEIQTSPQGIRVVYREVLSEAPSLPDRNAVAAA